MTRPPASSSSCGGTARRRPLPVRWDPGDGNEVVNGQGGIDTLDFNGSGVSETVSLAANGQRLTFFRDVANVTIDAGTLERVVFEAVGGVDTISVGNLRPTPVTRVSVDLDSVIGTGPGDGQPDLVALTGTPSADVVTVSASGVTTTAAGLGYAVRVVRPEAANDSLRFTGGAGDRVRVEGTPAGDAITVAALDLEGTVGGGAGDAQPDAVVVDGTSSPDRFAISASGTMAIVSGLAAQVRVDHPEAANDTLTVNGMAGFDRFTIGAGIPALIALTVNQ